MRWARFLRDLGHRVAVAEAWDGTDADAMVALHAWRSAASIVRFRDAHPDRPLVVALTGTDIYRFQHSHPETTLASMELADALVCLHGLVHEAIPDRFAGKLTVIHQSAPPLPGPRRPATRHFDVCVVGHLRAEKDPLRAAYAARRAPPSSRLRVVHFGKAHDETWAARARAQMAGNPRYLWRGEVPGWVVRRAYGTCRAMVLSSVMEGGANVASEAAVAGLPVLASDIHGNVGLLGAEYPGTYPVRDTVGLARLLRRAETEPAFLDGLEAHMRRLAPLFRPEAERQAWRDVLARLG